MAAFAESDLVAVKTILYSQGLKNYYIVQCEKNMTRQTS